MNQYEVLYFGCEDAGHLGHYLYDPGFMSLYGEKMPEGLRAHDLDGEYCPKTEPHQAEGLAKLHKIAGWTVIAFWDRSADKRYASNAAFLYKGDHTFEEVVAKAKEIFPTVWARFTFPIVQVVE